MKGNKAALPPATRHLATSNDHITLPPIPLFQLVWGGWLNGQPKRTHASTCLSQQIVGSIPATQSQARSLNIRGFIRSLNYTVAICTTHCFCV